MSFRSPKYTILCEFAVKKRLLGAEQNLSLIKNSKMENDFDYDKDTERIVCVVRPPAVCPILKCILCVLLSAVVHCAEKPENEKCETFSTQTKQLAMIFIDVRHRFVVFILLFLFSMKQGKLGFSDTFRYLRFSFFLVFCCCCCRWINHESISF